MVKISIENTSESSSNQVKSCFLDLTSKMLNRPLSDSVSTQRLAYRLLCSFPNSYQKWLDFLLTHGNLKSQIAFHVSFKPEDVIREVISDEERMIFHRDQVKAIEKGMAQLVLVDKEYFQELNFVAKQVIANMPDQAPGHLKVFLRGGLVGGPKGPLKTPFDVTRKALEVATKLGYSETLVQYLKNSTVRNNYSPEVVSQLHNLDIRDIESFKIFRPQFNFIGQMNEETRNEVRCILTDAAKTLVSIRNVHVSSADEFRERVSLTSIMDHLAGDVPRENATFHQIAEIADALDSVGIADNPNIHPLLYGDVPDYLAANYEALRETNLLRDKVELSLHARQTPRAIAGVERPTAPTATPAPQPAPVHPQTPSRSTETETPTVTVPTVPTAVPTAVPIAVPIAVPTAVGTVSTVSRVPTVPTVLTVPTAVPTATKDIQASIGIHYKYHSMTASADVKSSLLRPSQPTFLLSIGNDHTKTRDGLGGHVNFETSKLPANIFGEVGITRNSKSLTIYTRNGLRLPITDRQVHNIPIGCNIDIGVLGTDVKKISDFIPEIGVIRKNDSSSVYLSASMKQGDSNLQAAQRLSYPIYQPQPKRPEKIVEQPCLENETLPPLQRPQALQRHHTFIGVQPEQPKLSSKTRASKQVSGISWLVVLGIASATLVGLGILNGYFKKNFKGN